MVSAVLSHAGHIVDLASDEWEALIRAGRARPDVVVTELRLPTSNGWKLAENLRGQTGSAAVPFIFLASLRSERSPGPSFRTESDQIVAKPFRLEQLEEAVSSALSGTPGRGIDLSATSPPRGAVPPSPPSSPNSAAVRQPASRGDTEGTRRTVLSGSLDEFGVSSLLIVLELERKTGVVVLRSPQNIGRIFVRNGRVIRAHTEGAAAHRGPLAVYELLTWVRGRFEFNVGEVVGEDEIGSSTSFLLLEGARLQDERAHDKENN